MHDLKGEGIGTRLMAETAKLVISQRPGLGLYLWVLEQNTSAQAFYRARGGECVGRGIAQARGAAPTEAPVRLARTLDPVLARVPARRAASEGSPAVQPGIRSSGYGAWRLAALARIAGADGCSSELGVDSLLWTGRIVPMS